MEKHTINLDQQLQQTLQENLHCINIQLQNIKTTLELNQCLINTSTLKLQNILHLNISETNSTKLHEFEIAIGILSQILTSIINSTKALTNLKINLEHLKSYLEQDYGNHFVSQYLNDTS